MVIAALVAGVLGGVWWLVRGGRQARRLYRRWRWRNSIVVYGFGEPGRAWQVDAVVAAALAVLGPFAPTDLTMARVRAAGVGLLGALLALAWGGR